MSYRSAWFSAASVRNIARKFSRHYNRERGAGEDNDCNFAIYLCDRGSQNRVLRGAYGSNIESKLLAVGVSMRDIDHYLTLAKEYLDDFDAE